MTDQRLQKAKVLTGAWPGTPVSVPERRLDVALLEMKELVLRAFGEPLPAGVLVELLRGWRVPDQLFLFNELPWLHEIEDADRVVAALLKNGWAVLKCGSRADADRLCASFSRWAHVERLGS